MKAQGVGIDDAVTKNVGNDKALMPYAVALKATTRSFLQGAGGHGYDR